MERTIKENNAANNNTPIDNEKYNMSWFFDSSNKSRLSIDVEDVWQDYTGDGVRVAVIDSAIDHLHVDLADNYDANADFDFSTGSTDIELGDRYLLNSHGTNVAGIIAAVNNDIGSVGVAHGSSISSLAVDYSAGGVGQQIVNALHQAANFDVVNSSWSFTKPFADDFSVDHKYAAALEAPVTTGRDGLGTVMVFSAGNTGEALSSNYHSFQNSPYSIAVGAVDADGGASSFTSVGSNVLISAAGRGVYATRGHDRYENVNGTSFSAPVVSGVIALMLEANPELGYRDVQQILALSASRERLDLHTDHGNGWITNGATNHNGGGLHYSDAYGYGFVNAHDAVRLAETWTLQQTAGNRETVTVADDFNNLRMIAGENDVISFTIDVDSHVVIEHVQLQLDFGYKLIEDLDITLTSPSGTVAQLTYETDQKISRTIKDFPFTSVATMGEDATGEWIVEIINRDPNAVKSNGEPQEGLLRDYTLTLHGANDSQDDVYIYTNAYGTLSGDELSARNTLNDINGGVDIINAAAVTTNSIIDLSGATATQIAGNFVEFATASIEYAFSGDGDDTLIGSDSHNWLRGGRGDDTFVVSDGSDTIWGEEGTDTAIFDVALVEISGSFVQTDYGIEYTITTGSADTSSFLDVEFFNFTDTSLSLKALTDWLTGNNDIAQPVEPPKVEAPVVEEPTEPEQVNAPEEEQPETIAESPAEEGDNAAEPPQTVWILNGSAGIDVLKGGEENETIMGLEGDDRLLGYGGDDVLFGNEGRDKLFGGDGNDWLEGGEGRDLLKGDDGDDVLILTNDGDIAVGGAGADTFVLSSDAMTKRNLIRDFNALEGDVLDISDFVAANPDAEIALQQTVKGTMIVGTQSGNSVDLVYLRETSFDTNDIDELIVSGDFIL